MDLIKHFGPDEFFSYEQLSRLRALMDRLNVDESSLSSGEQRELNELIKTEFIASARRTSAMAVALGR